MIRRPHARRTIRSSAAVAVVEAVEARVLMSTVAPAFADKIGLAGVVTPNTTFEDNFDGSALDKTKWQVRDGYRWRASKDAPVSTFSYTDASAAVVGGGELALVAHNDPVTGQLKGAFLQSGRQFDAVVRNVAVPAPTLTPGYSGDFEQAYGYWETRAKFSALPGEWASFWVHSSRMTEVRDDPTKVNHPEVFGTEMDVVEHSATRGGVNSINAISAIDISNGYNSYEHAAGNYPDLTTFGAKTPPSEYHVYGLLWTPTAAMYYVDGILVNAITDPAQVSKVPHMAMLSMEVGAPNTLEDGKGNNFFGYVPGGGYGPVATSKARATFDYVRVWGLAGQTPPAPDAPASASGTAYVDADNNGQMDATDPRAAGATAFADYDFDGVKDANEPSALTAADGTYRIDGLIAHAAVHLTVVPPAGYVASTPPRGYLNYVVFPGENSVRRDFGLAAGSTPTPTPTPVPTPTPTADPQLVGTPIGTGGSYQNLGNTIAKAFDGNLSSFFDGANADGNVVGLDLGVACLISQVKYAPRGDYPFRMNGGVIQASNSADFSNAVTLLTISATPVVGALTAASVSNATAYRYVRFASPAGGYGNVAELQFFGTVPNGGTQPTPTPVTPTPPTPPTPTPPTPVTPVTLDPQLTGTPIGTGGSYQNLGGTIAKAFDGNLSTFFDGAAASGNVVGLDFGSAKLITAIAYAPRAGYALRMAGGFFQGSNTADFASTTTLSTVAAAPAYGSMTTVAISNAIAFRYVRFVSPAGGYGNVAELQFFGTGGTATPPPVDPTPTPPAPTPPTPVAPLAGTAIGTAGSYQNLGNTIAKAFDGSLASFVDFAAPSGGWTGLDFGGARTVTSIRFAPRAGYAGRMVGGQFQFSSTADFSADVVTIAAINGGPAVGSLTTISVAAPAGAYRYVRYLGPGGGYGNVAELQFFGTAPTTV